MVLSFAQLAMLSLEKVVLEKVVDLSVALQLVVLLSEMVVVLSLGTLVVNHVSASASFWLLQDLLVV